MDTLWSIFKRLLCTTLQRAAQSSVTDWFLFAGVFIVIVDLSAEYHIFSHTVIVEGIQEMSMARILSIALCVTVFVGIVSSEQSFRS